MKTLNEYRSESVIKESAKVLVENNIDPVVFCNYIMETAIRCDTEEELYNEIMGGLGGLAKSAGGKIGSSFKNVFGDAASGIKRGAQNIAGGAANLASKAGQGIKDIYQAGEAAAAVKRAEQELQKVTKTLTDAGFDPNAVKHVTDYLQNVVRAGKKQGVMTPDQQAEYKRLKQGQDQASAPQAAAPQDPFAPYSVDTMATPQQLGQQAQQTQQMTQQANQYNKGQQAQSAFNARKGKSREFDPNNQPSAMNKQ